jgi:hypothetical protein
MLSSLCIKWQYTCYIQSIHFKLREEYPEFPSWMDNARLQDFLISLTITYLHEFVLAVAGMQATV